MADLKVIIGGDAGQLQSELKKSQNELAKTAIAANNLDSSLKKTSASGAQSMFNLTEKIRSLQSSVFTEKDTAKISLYNAEIKKTEAELAKLSALGTGGGLGAIGKGATEAYSAVRKLAYILPGVGIAGILSFAIEPISKFINSLFAATAAEQKLAEQSKFINDLNNETAKNYGKEISSLQILRGAIESTTTPMATRLQAIKDLKKEFPGLFTGLTNEQLLTGNVANAYDLAAQAILRKARASAAASALEDIAAKKLIILQKNQIDLDKTLAEQQKARDQTTTRKGLGDAAGTQVTNTAAAQKAGLLIAYNLRKKAAQDEIDQLNQQQAFLLDIATKGADQTIKIEKDKNEKTKKEIRSVQDVLNDLANQIDFLNKKQILTGVDESKNKIKAMESALDELLKKFKLTASNPIIIDLAFRINKATYELDSSAFLQRELEKIKQGPERTLEVKPKITVKPILNFESANFTKEMTDQLRKAVDATASAMTSISTSAITSVLEGLANVATGKGGIGDIFSGLAKVLGAGVKQFGEQILQLAILAKIAKAAIKNPITGIAAGIALIALGSLIESAASKNAFATGVQNFGGGIALVGERGPELVQLPKGSSVQTNGQLNAMNSREVYISETVIRGTDLVTIYKKATAYNSRNGY